MKKFTLLSFLLFTLSLVLSPAVIADSISDDPEADLPLNEDITDAKSELRRAEQFFRDSELNWETRIETYLDDPTDENLTSARTYAKQLINQTIDLYDKYYTLITARANNISGLDPADQVALLANTETEQSWLQTQRVSIAESTENTQIVSVATALNNYRTEKLAFHFRVVGLIAGSRINKSITVLTDAANRIADYIAVLTDLEKDTTKLETLYASLTEKVDQARTEYATALEGVRAITNSDTAVTDFATQEENLNTAKTTLTDGQVILDEIVTEFKNVKADKIGGSGTLEAAGEGKILIVSDGTVTISSEDELTVTVYDHVGDIVIDAVGTGTTDAEGRKTTYSGYSQLTLTGDAMTVLADGSVSDLSASGTGRAYLSGTGTYQSSGDETAKDYTEAGVLFNISS